MKILKIRTQNINSLKGNQEVDFSREPLKEAGLFAITGMTGSGKTTILDAITLALYNRIPRVPDRISKNFIAESGVILTRNTTEGFAEVTYECSEGTYISKWSIKKTRNGTFSDYHMEIAEAGSKTPLDIKKGAVPDKNSDLIGLDFNQFVRAIILAQGDFASFLKAKEDERGKILEQITGGDIYRKLGIKAFEMYKKHGKVVDDKKNQREQLQKLLLDEEALEELKNSFQQSEKETKAMEKLQNELKEALKVKAELAAASESKARLIEVGERLKSGWEEFEKEKGGLLAKHRKLIPVQEQLEGWKNRSDEAEKANKEIYSFKQQVEILEAKEKALREEIKTFTKGLTHDPVKALSEFQQQISEYDRDISKYKSLRDSALKSLAASAGESGIQTGGVPVVQVEAENSRRMEEVTQENQSIESGLTREVKSDPETAIAGLRSAQETINEILSELKLISSREERLTKEQQQAEEIGKTLKLYPQKIKEKRELKKNAGLRFDKLRLESENRKLRASLEDHRKNLKPGEPCPLCGALEHPLFEGEEDQEDTLKTKLKTAEEAFEREKKDLLTLEANQKSDDRKYQQIIQEIETERKSLKEKAEAVMLLHEKLPEKYRKTEHSQLKNIIEQDISTLERYTRNLGLLKKLIKNKELIGEILQLEKNLEDVKKKRSEKYEGDNIVSDTDKLREAWSKNAAGLNNFRQRVTESKESLAKNQQEKESFMKAMQNHLTSLSYSGPEEAYKDLLTPSDAEQLRTEEDALKEQMKQNSTERELNKKQIEKLKKEDREETPEQLKTLQNEVQEKYTSKKDLRDEQAGKLKSQQGFRESIALLNAEIERLRHTNLKWNLLYQYIGDKEGKKFSTFAQRLTLYKLILLANKRLATLSDRYLLDIPKQDEDESLSVVDTHMGDQRRSVKSLSGGETFIISLSLALALSDLAARNIKINSLFIDEGFGSLDKLTLDQTIDTLEKLQYESGKNIGVISHVEAMQERITTQVEVQKNGQGYSSIHMKP